MIVTLALLALYLSLSLPWIGHPLKHALGHLIAHIFIYLGEWEIRLELKEDTVFFPIGLFVLTAGGLLSIPILLLMHLYWAAGSVALVFLIIVSAFDPGRIDIHKYENSSVKRQGRGDTA